MSWPWEEFLGLPADEVTVDIRRTKWSKLDTMWRGTAQRFELQLAPQDPIRRENTFTAGPEGAAWMTLHPRAHAGAELARTGQASRDHRRAGIEQQRVRASGARIPDQPCRWSGRSRWRPCAFVPAALDGFDEPLRAASVELLSGGEGLSLELVAPPVDYGDLSDVGRVVVEAIGVLLDGEAELRQVVVVA
jgi:hypothetical protein